MNLNGTKITWLGHGTFLLERNGKSVLIDPWLAGNPACPERFWDISPDLVLITHGHGDHIGNVFDVAGRGNAPIVGIYDLTTWLGNKGVDGSRLVGMNKGGTVRFEELGLSVSLTDARHSSSFVEEDGTIVYLGEPCGLIVNYDDGPTIYHAGDTCLFGDMEWIAKIWSPDLAILPIGDHFTMDPRQAAFATQMLGVQAVIGGHWGTFPLLHGTPAALKDELAKLGVASEVIALEPGQTAA